MQKETIEQINFIKMVRQLQHFAQIPDLAWLHCSLNGVKLTALQSIISSQMGMVAGICDIFWAKPLGGYHGFYIEMKSAKGRVTPQQKLYIDYLIANNYYVDVCYSCGEAYDKLLNYLKLDENYKNKYQIS